MEKMQFEWPDGIKKTKPRELILTVLENSDSPLCAMDICSLIDKKGTQVWLSTVYRVLETFVNKGIVIKTTIMDNEMAIYELNRYQHKHYAICLCCHKIIPMNNCPMERFVPKLSDNDFQVLGHKVEIYGYCTDCTSKKNKKSV